MKFYKDSDPYVYNETLYNKSKKIKSKYKRIISALMACQIFCTTMAIETSVKYEIDHSNPFDGNRIVSSDFSTNYKAIYSRNFIENESLKRTIESIKNSDIDEKKAYILYYALLSNDSLTKEEKEKLVGYIQYFIDNKYLDYEYLYNKFNDVRIIERNSKFPGTNISSIYNKTENSIKLGNINDLPHEVRHSIMDVPGQTWLNEGYDCIISEEYDNDYGSSVETNVIRLLCEMIGKEDGRNCFFEISSKNDINILTNKLVEKGIDESYCEELYSLLNSLSITNGMEKDNELEYKRNIIRKKISGLLAKMIKESDLDNSIKESSIVIEYLNRISLGISTNLSIDKFYYFNSKKIQENPILTQISYYYPEKLSKSILENRKEFLWEVIQFENDNIWYIVLNEDELDMCESTNILEIKKEYVDNKEILYKKDGNTNKWIYHTTHKISISLDDYAYNYEYYQNNETEEKKL